MILTGKAQKEFAVFLKTFIQEEIAYPNEITLDYDVSYFYKYPFNMQFAVYQDFFATKEIYVCLNFRRDFQETEFTRDFDIEFIGSIYCGGVETNDIKILRKNAIEKAGEIYNTEKVYSNIIK